FADDAFAIRLVFAHRLIGIKLQAGLRRVFDAGQQRAAKAARGKHDVARYRFADRYVFQRAAPAFHQLQIRGGQPGGVRREAGRTRQDTEHVRVAGKIDFAHARGIVQKAVEAGAAADRGGEVHRRYRQFAAALRVDNEAAL